MTNRYLPTPVLHRVVEKNGFVFVGGTAADDTSLDIKGQTREAIAKLETYLAAAGSDKTKLLFIWVYLADLGDKQTMNEVMQEWIAAEDMPARATICPRTLAPDTLIELIVTAHK